MLQPVDITTSTYVTFPTGATAGFSRVLWVKEQNAEPCRAIVVTQETPYHPIDHIWPDQPADLGSITVEGMTFTVVDALTGAIHLESGQLYLDQEIPVKSGVGGWIFVVAHLVALPADYPLMRLRGKPVWLEVDKRRRQLLSASHSACHLMALALNKGLSKI